jgi:hypothetical protein
MRRREFIAVLSGAAAWPVVAGAQQAGTKMPDERYLSMPSTEVGAEVRLLSRSWARSLPWANSLGSFAVCSCCVRHSRLGSRLFQIISSMLLKKLRSVKSRLLARHSVA